jgi:hypothetical protein
MTTQTTSAGPPPGAALRVALVCMPFAAAERPSIQIGLLAALAARAGFAADCHHLNLELAARLTPEVYDPLCNHRGHMTGEWLFAVAAFGEGACRDEAYFGSFPEEVAWARKGGRDAADLSRLRHDVLPRFIDDCLGMADWGATRWSGSPPPSSRTSPAWPWPAASRSVTRR